MSKIFYDHLIVFEEIEVELDKLELSREEREEIDQLIEELVHHHVVERILDHLPREHHEEFLDKFHAVPHDPALLHYINKRIDESVEVHIKDEMKKLKKEILKDVKNHLLEKDGK